MSRISCRGLRRCWDSARTAYSSRFLRTYTAHSGALSAVLSFGEGSQGALGCNDVQDNYEPEHVVLPQDMVSLAAGHYHSLAVTSSGHLYTWGRNSEKQLGWQQNELCVELFASRPARVAGLPKVSAAAASGVVSFAVANNGTLLAWGSSKRGQLGLGPGVVVRHAPERLRNLEGITQVACGWGHAVALREDGAVFAWGFPQHGRLGHSHASDPAQEEEEELMRRCVWQPQCTPLPADVRVKQVACGLDHTLALAEDGCVFTFGDNSLGQLGHPRATTNAAEPFHLLRDSDGHVVKAVRVAAGLGHSLAVTEAGCVLSWGWNAAGQLGLGASAAQHVIAHPRRIFGLPENPQDPGLRNHQALVAAGRVHSIAVTDDVPQAEQAGPLTGAMTQIYAWGSGHSGRLGLGTQQDRAAPELLPELDGERIWAVACGHDHTLVAIVL